VSGVAVRTDGLVLEHGTRRVLDGVSIAIGAGERVALVGPNGAGKTSVLRCLTGLATPTAGSVEVDGSPLPRIPRERLARLMAVVPAEVTIPFAMRVEELVAIGRIPHEHRLSGLRPADHAAIERAIERAGIGHLRGRDVRTLSLGERQLVLIATALAQEGRLLLLDEPTVHLDLRHQVGVLRLLADLSEQDGLTVIAVLHDLALVAELFPRVVLLDHGRVIADGTPADALGADRLHSVYGVDPRYLPRIADPVSLAG